MRLQSTSRRLAPRPNRALCGAALALVLATLVVTTGCSDAANSEFRNNALATIGSGLKTAFGGLVDGVVALLIPDPPSGEQSGTGTTNTTG